MDQYKCTLIGASDCLRVSSRNLDVHIGNLNLCFFSELTATPEDWLGLLASKQELLDELITDEDYDPLDPSQCRLESRLRKSLLKNYVNYNDYNHFDASDRLQHKPVEPEPAVTYTSPDNKEDGYDDNCVSSILQRHIESRLQKELQKAVKDYVNYNEYNPCNASEQHKSRKRKAPPSLTMMMIFLFHCQGSKSPTTII